MSCHDYASVEDECSAAKASGLEQNLISQTEQLKQTSRHCPNWRKPSLVEVFVVESEAGFVRFTELEEVKITLPIVSSSDQVNLWSAQLRSSFSAGGLYGVDEDNTLAESGVYNSYSSVREVGNILFAIVIELIAIR